MLGLQDIRKITELIEKKFKSLSLLKNPEVKGEIAGSEEKPSYDLTKIEEQLKQRDQKLVEQQEKITELEGKNKKLETDLQEFHQQLQDKLNSLSTGNFLGVNDERFGNLEKQLITLKNVVASLKFEPEEISYDLRKEFKKEVLFGESKIELDSVSTKPIQGQVINLAFKKILEDSKKKKVSAGYENYKFGVRAIETVLTLRE